MAVQQKRQQEEETTDKQRGGNYTNDNDSNNDDGIFTLDELEAYASKEGISLSFTTLGPGYRSVSRFDPPTSIVPPPASTAKNEISPSNSLDDNTSDSSKGNNNINDGIRKDSTPSSEENQKLVLGYVEGFIRPAGNILHLDKMEVYQPILNRAKRQYIRQYEYGQKQIAMSRQEENDNKGTLTTDDDGSGNDDVKAINELPPNPERQPSQTLSPTSPSPPPILHLGGISFGVGLLMGYQCLLYGKSRGCTTAEFLAIDDEPKQHRRLVKYYRRVGFKVVRYVGDDWKDVPDRLVWGGCGTLMTEDIDVLIRKWSNLLRLMVKRSEDNRAAKTKQ